MRGGAADLHHVRRVNILDVCVRQVLLDGGLEEQTNVPQLRVARLINRDGLIACSSSDGTQHTCTQPNTHFE